MSVSAEMYLVVSLMMAVFAAVAAVGTSVVLGAGFERLRAGFEVIKNQTGFFANAIHELDKRADRLEEQAGRVHESVATMSDKVERVEKQTGFFADAIHSLEQKILEGSPVETKAVQEVAVTDEITKPQPELSIPISWIVSSSDDAVASDEDQLVDNEQHMEADDVIEMPPPTEQQEGTQPQVSLGSLLSTYFRSEGRGETGEIVYH